MTTERIKEIQDKTAYPNSVSVQQALFQVWLECEANAEKKEVEETIFSRLKKYCEKTSPEQIQKDWEATAKYDKVSGPTGSEEENEIEWDTDLEFVERRFLNQSNFHSTASIVAKISGQEDFTYPWAELYITDCNKVITLEMDCNSEEAILNTEFKLRQIIEVSTNMLKAVTKLRPYIEKVKNNEKTVKINN